MENLDKNDSKPKIDKNDSKPKIAKKKKSSNKALKKTTHTKRKLNKDKGESAALKTAKDLELMRRPGGRINFENVTIPYEGLTKQLENITFEIFPREKVGMVGDHLSGKQAILVALYRLIEVSNGAIKIDDEDIKNVELPLLRKDIKIINRRPVVFPGTYRTNLDPFNEKTDDVLWEALGKTSLKNKILSNEKNNGLNTTLKLRSFSSKDRQLLNIIQAMLKKPKIILLEDVAEEEGETIYSREEILELVFNEFKDCTVVFFTHNASTIEKCERIFYFQDGELIEEGRTDSLLLSPSSKLSQLVLNLCTDTYRTV